MYREELEEKGFSFKSFEEGNFWTYEIDDEAVMASITELPKIKKDDAFFFDEFSCIIIMIREDLQSGQLWNVDTDVLTPLSTAECDKILKML